MSEKVKKRKKGTSKGKVKKQMVLAPRREQDIAASDASTLLWEKSATDMDTTQGTEFNFIEQGGEIISDTQSLSSIGEAEDGAAPTDPVREDRPINTERWDPDEVDALMTAMNINRDALKFHFDGPGGGKEVKRQAWRDVVAYVNSTADTHRTVAQCRSKADDYTQRVKAKFNRLRFEVSRTGRGAIKKSLKLKDTENKALDYLREEAVKGIPDIEPMDVGGPEQLKPSRRNKKLLWNANRKKRPKYEDIEMDKVGVPNNYRDAKRRKEARKIKEKNRKENKKQMLKERKEEKERAREYRKEARRQLRLRKQERRERKERKKEREAKR